MVAFNDLLEMTAVAVSARGECDDLPLAGSSASSLPVDSRLEKESDE
jgi:hypothetical protein